MLAESFKNYGVVRRIMNNDILHIQCPNNNIEERKYIIDVLLKQFLGIDYSIIYSDTVQNYELWYDSRKVVVEDHFLQNFPITWNICLFLTYLKVLTY